MRVALKLMLAVSTIAMALPAAASAQTSSDQQSVKMPGQTIAETLREISQTTGVQIVFLDPELARLPSPAISDGTSARSMLREALKDSGYDFRFTNRNTVRVFRKSARAAKPTKISLAPSRQDQSAVSPDASQQNESVELDEIVVTGTRLQSGAFNNSVPTQQVTAQELAESGFTDLAQSLDDVPGISLADSNVGQPAGAIQNAGTSTVNLRNLGANRTLVLIDGRRTVSNAANRNVVSLNTIPQAFIDRVDVITGAASAIYGSDAVAGVVNIVTESRQQGFRIRGRNQFGLNEGGGGSEYTLSGSYGTRFADDRGYFLVAATYEKDEGIFARQRLPRAGAPTSFDATNNVVDDPVLSTDIPGGRFRGSNFYFTEAGLQRNFVTAVNGYNDRPEDTLRAPRDLLAVAAKGSLRLSDAFEPFFQIQFSDLDSFFSRAPIGIRDTTEVVIRDPATGLPAANFPLLSVGRISRTSPLAPALIRTGAPSSGIDFRRRFIEVGNRETFNDRDTLRGWVGARGNLSDAWSYELSYGYGRFEQNQLRTGGVNLRDLRLGLDVEVDPANTSALRCRDATARANGCVPVNIFGVGTISPEAAAYIRADSTFRSVVRQDVVLGYVTGSFGGLPAGDIGVVIGGEYRRDASSLQTDEETRTGFTTTSGIPGFNESFSVREAFVEATVPLLGDVPFVKSLTLDFAGRVAEYTQSNVGTVFSYRAGLNWQMADDLRFRAQYGTAVRAPDLSELFSPPRDDADTVVDICNGVTATTAGLVAANCRRVPGIAAEISSSGRFTQNSTNVRSPNGGNRNLDAERARTITAGVVATPRFVPGLTLSADYYNIRVNGAIDSFTNETILNQCYSATDFPSNSFCSLISRNSVDGEIQEIVQREQNLNQTRVSGFDVRLRYERPLDGIGVNGELLFGLDWTHSIENETDFAGLTGVQTDFNNGEINSPKNEFTARIGYEDKEFRTQWRARYIGPVVASNERVADALLRNVTDPLFLNYDAYWRHDWNFTLRVGNAPRLRLTGGINNIFNKTGPNVPEGATPDAQNGYIPQYGIVGRTGFVGFEMSF
jgi:iron complex outermembrane recepter protein